jgi:hypothetical protein
LDVPVTELSPLLEESGKKRRSSRRDVALVKDLGDGRIFSSRELICERRGLK